MTSYGTTNSQRNNQEDSNDDNNNNNNLDDILGVLPERKHITCASMPAVTTRTERSPLNPHDSSASIESLDLEHHPSPSRRQQRRMSDPVTYDNNNNENEFPFWSNRSDGDDTLLFPAIYSHWFPDAYECNDLPGVILQSRPTRRSLKRRLFLFLTEPTTSIAAGILFILVGLAIFFMNIVMIMQTMNHWQYTPDDCISCGGPTVYIFEDDTTMEEPTPEDVPCVCPPTPVAWTDKTLKYLIYFFTVEWTLRILLFAPPAPQNGKFWRLWFAHLTDTSQILDALAIFPFYLESISNTNGLMSLRLLRLFRVFQLLRLGQYNDTFLVLTNVLWKSTMYLKLLMVVLVFGSALFGSMMYWLEKGTWQYHQESGVYRWMRIGVDGITVEPSPFTSIPAAFWWFMVTATTVGYGDVYPTTTSGKCVATVAMLTGVLVVAFPVSVFSDLWASEVQRQKQEQHESEDPAGAGPLSPNDHNNNNQLDTNINNGELEPNGGFNHGEAHYHSTRAKDMDAIWSTLNLSNLNPLSSMDDDDMEGKTTPLISRKKPATNNRNTATVTLQRDDFLEIVNRLDSIQENEAEIRNILKKYQPGA